LGELANSKPFGLLLKGFLIFRNYFKKKEGFLNRTVVYRKQSIKNKLKKSIFNPSRMSIISLY